MGSIKMGIGLGLWHHGMPDAATLFEYIDKAEAWGIDSVWLSDHLMGARQEVAIMPMMAAIAARTQRLKNWPTGVCEPVCKSRELPAVGTVVSTVVATGGIREGQDEPWNAHCHQRLPEPHGRMSKPSLGFSERPTNAAPGPSNLCRSRSPTEACRHRLRT